VWSRGCEAAAEGGELGDDDDGWTTIAVDRASRRCSVAQGRRPADAAREAYERLYEP
jgi:hypothetical protein